MKISAAYRLRDLSVAIVDDHALVLEGFKSLLNKHGVNDVVTFSKAAELMDILPAHGFDIYIVDIGMPDVNGFVLIDAIRERYADARIIVNTIHEEIWLIRRMLDRGVNAILYKTTDFSRVIEAIVTVLNGERYFCPEYRKTLKRLDIGNDIPSLREIEVLRDIARGYTSKEIASHLFVSENTVESHRKSLFSKLKARNIADLVMKAVAMGYIMPSDYTDE
ncbi:response regulator transcription factor [Prevotella sp. PCHR]|uniref:Response regulator transcription factor n=3 Tax=Xylanibacter caecicola TaxID=2736294 RepID=A0ABX2B5U8_9BACT|nr:response regulator transcription factor [Xylanibacter caecicola]NPE26050.1 response regulator transcription factor [Xylanibacter caecicola]